MGVEEKQKVAKIEKDRLEGFIKNKSEGKTTLRSMRELELEDISDAKNTISTINSGRKTEYAEDISKRWFNKKANKKAAHNIRMNSEIKTGANK